MSELSEISKRLRKLAEVTCCISTASLSSNQLLLELKPKNTQTKLVTLTGSLVALSPSTPCSCVTLINNDTNTSITYTSNGGTEISLGKSAMIPLYVSNINLVQVKGTGTLSYLIDF